MKIHQAVVIITYLQLRDFTYAYKQIEKLVSQTKKREGGGEIYKKYTKNTQIKREKLFKVSRIY